MDIELGAFFNFLDQQVGKDQYVVFLTADHGVSHVPGFLQKHKHPGGNIDDDQMIKELNNAISQKFGVKNVVLSGLNYQLALNNKAIDSAGVNRTQLTEFMNDFVIKQPGIDRVFPCSELYKELIPSLVRERFSNGYHPKRSGDIQLLFQPGWIDGGKKGTTHGLWNPYDSHIPLIWYGRGITKGRSNAVVYMTDIAPTLAALLRIQMPNGCIGSPILPVLSEK
jgi:arylsulfatase A-like enzyme